MNIEPVACHSLQEAVFVLVVRHFGLDVAIFAPVACFSLMPCDFCAISSSFSL